MTLLVDILEWSKADLPLWQRDAVRRLFQQDSELSAADYDDLYTLLKAASGVASRHELEPVPLSEAHLPAVPEVGERVVLKAMRDLANVNRLRHGEKLSFSPDGITIVYGANASGKSGYARVMKKVCRARDQAEEVLPDASLPAESERTPSATFDIDVEGCVRELHWDADSVPPPELSRFSVFDSRCARVYVTDEQDVAYLPYGLDVLENLANRVLPELSRRLESEIEAISVDRQPFDHLLGETRVGHLVSSLSEATTLNEIDLLATLTEEERGRLTGLRQTLSEADPSTRAAELRLSAKRVKELAARVDAACESVSDNAVNRLQSLQIGAASAARTEMAAAEVLRSGETLLPGTGESTWKALFEAARRFSMETACPGHSFPNAEEQAVCPLCQQTLSSNASQRLERFEAYVRKDAAKTADLERERLASARRKIEHVDLRIGLDGSVADELDHLDRSLAPGVRAFEASLDQRRAWILGALDSGAWEPASPVGENPRRRLRSRAATQLCQARTCEVASSELGREALDDELAELEARSNLAGCSKALWRLVECMKRKTALERCKDDLKTRHISDKSKEFAGSAVTAALRTAMEREFNNLDVGHVRLALKERIEKGKIKHRLVLDLPMSSKLGDILSEGEQRAIALGSFLAELSLAGHSDGIVFDDPVSSLDHWRRQHLAKRLVVEAGKRQVVVFTHDTSFLGQLRDEIEASHVSHSIQYLEWQGDEPGHVHEGLPWEHQGYKARLDALEKAQRRLAAIPWPTYPNETQRAEMAHHYDLLRATIERIVQDVVFGGVVKRYRDWIRMDCLDVTVGFEALECREIRRLHGRCCAVVDAHDPSSDKNAAVPSAAALAQDIQSLNDVVETIKTRRKSCAAATKISEGDPG